MLTTSQKRVLHYYSTDARLLLYCLCQEFWYTNVFSSYHTFISKTWNFNLSILKNYYFSSNLQNFVSHNSECSYFSGRFLKAVFIFCTYPPFLSIHLEFKYEGTQKLQFCNYCKMNFLSQTQLPRCQHKSLRPKLNMVIVLPIPVVFMQQTIE